MKPRHHGAILLALTTLFSVAGTAVAIATYAQGNNVTIDETVLYGDKALVEDVVITQDVTWSNHLVWTTKTPLSNPSSAATTLQQSRNSIRPEVKQTGDMEVYFAMNQSMSTSSFYNFEDKASLFTPYPLAMFADVASRVPVGESHTEIVRVADYGDYYLPDIRVSLPGDEEGLRFYFGTDDPDNILSTYFRQPVEENDTVTVTMTADAEGKIFDISLESNNENNDKGYSQAAFQGNTAYLVMDKKGTVEIHRMDFRPEEHGWEMTAETVQKVAEIPDAYVYNGEPPSIADNRLFLLTASEPQGKADTLTIFDLTDMTVVQSIFLNFTPERIVHGEDFFVLQDPYQGDFAVYVPDGKGYGLALSGNSLTHGDPEYYNLYNTVMDYKNGKLVTAFYRNSSNFSTYITVNTDKGCEFTGLYVSSLDKDSTDSYEKGLRLWQDMDVFIW